MTMLQQRREFYDELRNQVSGLVRIATVDRVQYELQRLARRGSSKTAGLAGIALDQLERRKVEVLETIFGLPDVDTAIVAAALAERTPVAVATVDRQLRDILSRHGILTISPTRQQGLMTSR